MSADRERGAGRRGLSGVRLGDGGEPPRAGSIGSWGAVRTLAWTAGAFGAGAIPSGRILTRALTGRRLEDLGDGKPGSANVARSVGWKAGAAVLAMDALKAFAPPAAARRLGAGHGATAAVGVAAMAGHIGVVKGRGAACALGALFAINPPMMAIGCVPLIGGSLMHRHAQAVTVTALSIPVISLALHRDPKRTLGPLAVVTLLFAARLRGSRGAGWPDSPEVWWNRFWLDRDER